MSLESTWRQAPALSLGADWFSSKGGNPAIDNLMKIENLPYVVGGIGVLVIAIILYKKSQRKK